MRIQNDSVAGTPLMKLNHQRRIKVARIEYLRAFRGKVVRLRVQRSVPVRSDKANVNSTPAVRDNTTVYRAIRDDLSAQSLHKTTMILQ